MMETEGLSQKQLKGWFWAFREIQGARGALYLPYSSRMTFNTRRTMLPTVVSDGWAAVILWPSVRIRSMSSPERGEGLGYRCPARVSIKPVHPLSIPGPAAAPAQGPQHQHTAGRGPQTAARSTGGFCRRKRLDTTQTSGRPPAAHLVFPLLLERSVLGLKLGARLEQDSPSGNAAREHRRRGKAPPWQDQHRDCAGLADPPPPTANTGVPVPSRSPSRRRALTGPAPSPVPDDLPQQ